MTQSTPKVTECVWTNFDVEPQGGRAMSERAELLRIVAGRFIHKGVSLAAWCPVCQVALLSDQPEVGHEDTCPFAALVRMFDEADARIAYLESELKKAGTDWIGAWVRDTGQ